MRTMLVLVMLAITGVGAMNLLDNPSFEVWEHGKPCKWQHVEGQVFAEDRIVKSGKLSLQGYSAHVGQTIIASCSDTVCHFNLWVWMNAIGPAVCGRYWVAAYYRDAVVWATDKDIHAPAGYRWYQYGFGRRELPPNVDSFTVNITIWYGSYLDSVGFWVPDPVGVGEQRRQIAESADTITQPRLVFLNGSPMVIVERNGVWYDPKSGRRVNR